MEEKRKWHRLFGMSLTDFFVGQPVTVEMEIDLSLKQQYLDVVVVRKEGLPLTCTLPDGFEELAAHNLISFKSFQEALDGWAMNELIGHYVNYRKQVNKGGEDPPPESDFRLFAVCVRYPRGLAGQVPLDQVKDGVYRARGFSHDVRVVVVHQLPQESRNALLHLFSALDEQRLFAAREYRPRSQETSTFLFQLYDRCREEGMPMPYTKEEFVREAMEKIRKDPDVLAYLLKDPEFVKKAMESVPVEKRLEGVPVEALREALAERQPKGKDEDTPP